LLSHEDLPKERQQERRQERRQERQQERQLWKKNQKTSDLFGKAYKMNVKKASRFCQRQFNSGKAVTLCKGS
jgi:replication fork clamp-binding protein CrfC